jgi:hypothetical protein
VSKTVEERLRSLADSIESESECQHASEVYDALMLGAKALDLLVSQFYVQHIGMCEWNRPYPTGTEPRCTCGLREILHGEVRPQDKPGDPGEPQTESTYGGQHLNRQERAAHQLHVIDGREGECWCGPHIVHVTMPKSVGHVGADYEPTKPLEVWDMLLTDMKRAAEDPEARFALVDAWTAYIKQMEATIETQGREIERYRELSRAALNRRAALSNFSKEE